VANAIRAGATEEEIWDVCRVAISLGGGPAIVYGGFTMEVVGDLKRAEVPHVARSDGTQRAEFSPH
jgi:alkylhydroperoxidase/carboxymuconolactone decarboxylase family protein YurZ